MAFKKSIPSNLVLNLAVVLAILAPLFVAPAPVLAAGQFDAVPLPELAAFTQSVINGDANVLRGVYVPGVLALPIAQQPYGYPAFVSENPNEVTQFSMAAEVGNVGLLAHNYLAGNYFLMLAPGQEVSLVYGDGRIEAFIVKRVVRYQALSPLSPYSEFRDLETNVVITAEELFRLVYRGERHVTFQTCINAEGNASWGRLFVIAEPKPIIVQSYPFHMSNNVN
jgi:hypothetical protein